MLTSNYFPLKYQRALYKSAIPIWREASNATYTVLFPTQQTCTARCTAFMHGELTK